MQSPTWLCATGVFLRLAAFVAALGISQASAVYTLTHNNSTVTVDPTSQNGMYTWNIDGANYLNQQWFWYRVGSSGPENALNSISSPAVTFNPLDPRRVTATYQANSFNVEVSYFLTGGAIGSGWSDVAEQITINNTSGALLDFHFFQYSDFDLSAGNDTITLGRNILNKFNEARQTGDSYSLAETVVTPGANRGEAAMFSDTRDRLNDAFTDTLNNVTTATGNVTWAFQWDLRIASGGSVVISKDKLLQIPPIPEPSSMALMGLGALALALRRRK